MPTFDIILTSFERPEYLKRTVASLVSSGAFKACQRFIIVDNHSLNPNVQTFLRQMETFEKTFIIHRPKNDGWASAVNDALGISRGEYLLLINNDVEFTPDFHLEMLKVLKDNESIGILAGWRHIAHSLVEGGWSGAGFEEMTDVPAVCWMLPKRAMEKAGMFEEHGPCATKGGNGEDTAYVMHMKACGYLTGATVKDVATHIDGY